MGRETRHKLNWLQRHLPEGLVVDAAWLEARGYSDKLRHKYVSAGWLHQPAYRVYQRRQNPVDWHEAVISLQTLQRLNVVVAGLSALEYHGFAHYLRRRTTIIHLSGPNRPPTWLYQLIKGVTFLYRNDIRLFKKFRASTVPHSLKIADQIEALAKSPSLHLAPWGPWHWPLILSTPERAILELVNELPDHETFDQVDSVMAGLATLSPTKLNMLLADCRSIKTKRLFFFFAERHKHAWLKHINRTRINLGRGKRMIAKGGYLDAKYQITVPRNLDAH